jgi:hypothetical protein
MIRMTPDLPTTYVLEPDIPIGMTIAEYRASRPRRPSWWRRMIGASR